MTGRKHNGIAEITKAHKLTRRQILKGTLAAAAVASVGPFFLRESSAAQAADEWKVGLIFPLTGHMAYGGNEGLIGNEIAQAIVNERGGVDTLSGKKKIVFAKADAPDQTAGTNEMNRLIGNEKVKVVIGSYASAICQTASPVADRNKIIYWENHAVTTDLTRRGLQYLFRTLAPVSVNGAGAITFLTEYIAPRLGMDPAKIRVAVAHEDSAWGSSAAEGVMEGVKKHGVQLVANEVYNAKSTDLSPVVLKLKAADPDALVVASIGADAIVLCKQIREMNINPKAIIGVSAGWGMPNFAQNIGKASNGIFSSDFPTDVNARSLSPQALALRDDFVKRYMAVKKIAPTANAYLAFAGTMVLFDEVFPKVKNLDSAEIKAAALALDLPDGSMANGCGVKFIPHDQDNGGQNARAFCTVLQWADFKMHVVYPEKYANREPAMIPLPPWAERS